MYVIEVERLPGAVQLSEVDGSKRAMVLEPAGPPRWWTGEGDGLTEERGGAARIATREEAEAVALDLRERFRDERVRVVDAPPG